MVTSFPAYLEGSSLDYCEDGALKNRLDAKVNFCGLPFSSSHLQQALLNSQACAVGAMFVGMVEGLSRAPFGWEAGWRAGISTCFVVGRW